MADDTRVAKRRLERLLMATGRNRRYLEAFRNEGDAAEVARCERALKTNYSLIRSHCAKHDLELPHDVPDEDAE